MTYSIEAEHHLQIVKELGFNLWPMLFIYKKRSKLRVEIPDDVIISVCLEYIKRREFIKQGFPYFLQVLTAKSQEHFSNQNVIEGMKYKKEPVKLKITIG